MAREVTATVALLTYNGEEFLKEVLISILSQVNVSYEILVIDSGSADKTVRIIEEFNKKNKNIRLIQIKNSEYGHGKTRNFAIKEAKGEYVAFLTQDATPVTDLWLSNFITAFKLDSKIGLAFGPHVPRKNCNPIIERDITNHFASFGSDKEVLTQQFTSKNRLEELNSTLGFFSDVNSMVRKSAWEQVKFKEVSYAEDQILAHDMLKAGFKKAYVPTAAVFHSHSYPTSQYLRRYFDEYRGLKEAVGYEDISLSLIRVVSRALKTWKADAVYILRKKQYNVFIKIKWIYVAFWMNLFRQAGAYLGPRYNRLPVFVSNWLSLENNNKENNEK